MSFTAPIQNPPAAIRRLTVGDDGLTDGERDSLEKDFMRAPSAAARSHLAAWRERKRAA